MKYPKKYLYYNYFCFSIVIFFIYLIIFIGMLLDNECETNKILLPFLCCFLGTITFGFTFITLQYHNTTYKFSNNEIIYKRGIIFKNTQIVSYNKISAVNVHQSIIMKLFGISKLSIDSLCAHKDLEDEIIIYDYDNKIKGLNDLIVLKLKENDDYQGKIEENDNYKVKYNYTFKEAFLSVVYSFPFVIILIIFIIAIILSLTILKNYSDITYHPFYTIAIAIIFILGFISFVLSKYLQYYGYTINYDDDNIRLSYGLFVRKDYIINKKRIKGVVLSEDVIKKACGYTNVSFEMIGLGNYDSSNENAKPNDSFIPFIKMEKGNEIIKKILPECSYEYPTIKAKNNSYVFFILLPFIVLSLICLPIFIGLLKSSYLLTLVIAYVCILLFIIFLEKLAKDNQGIYYDDKKICLSLGSIVRKRYIILWENVVSVNLHTTVIRDKYDITSIYIYTNSGILKSTKRVMNVDKNEIANIDCKLIKQKSRRIINKCSD